MVGLVIAVGLERTVEYFHHRHQRHELEAALRQNGEFNRRYINDDLVMTQVLLDWALAQSRAVERSGRNGTLRQR